MKDRDKKADLLGALDPEEQHSGKYSGFSFCFVYLRLGFEKTGNPGTVNINTKKQNNFDKSLFYPAKGSGKG